MRTVERLGATCATRSKTLQHDFALAHDVGEVVALLEGALELQVLFFGLAAGDGGADVGQQLFVVPRLLNKVFRAGADGFDDVVHGAVGGDHDDRQLGLALLDLGQQLKSALAGQGQVEQHQVEVLLVENLAGPRRRRRPCLTAYPSSESSTSSDSRMAASSSMTRMLAWPLEGLVASAVADADAGGFNGSSTSDMDGIPQ